MIASSEDLSKMIVAASALGLVTPVSVDGWPDTFAWKDKTWAKGDTVVAQKTGEVQFVDYTSGDEYLVVYNE